MWTVDWILSQLEVNRHKACQKYARFAGVAGPPDSPFDKLGGRCLLGSEEFTVIIESAWKGKIGFKGIQRRSSAREDPRLDARDDSATQPTAAPR